MPETNKKFGNGMVYLKKQKEQNTPSNCFFNPHFVAKSTGSDRLISSLEF